MLKEFRTLLPYLRRYRYRYLLGFVCLAVVDAAQILIPQFIKRAVDIIASGTYAMLDILVWCVLLVAVAVVLSLGRFLWRFFIHGSSRAIENELRDKLFAHMIGLSSVFFQRHKVGDLMARATNDLSAVRMAIGMGFVALVDGTFMASAILIVMFVQNPGVTLWAVLPLPLVTVLILFFGNAVGKRFTRVQEAYSKLSEIAQESVSGIRVITTFVKEEYFTRKFTDANDEYLIANMALTKIFGFYFPLISFLSGLTTLILLRFGGVRVLDGSMSPGELVAMFSYLQMLIWPMVGAGFTVNMLQRGAKSLRRVNEILETESEIRSPDNPVSRKASSSHGIAIKVKNLTFAYEEAKPVLRDISISLPAGKTIGIFGKTGSGKSTFLKLLPRLLNPPPGTVFIDGIDVHDWDVTELRSLFGVTPQDTYLFSDSVRANIAYGMSEIQENRLRDAASLSTISRDMEDFKDGWDTIIGERGLTLSGGQKQRVSISRAIAIDPEILLLDDALSSVDTETEKKILDSLLNDRSGKTTILVSHRISALRRADYVVVFADGAIAEQGPPQMLADANGIYAETSKLQQFADAIDA
ncbi:MAG: ABC transporter ATP-binding protein [Treponemataceae bacterium]